jgi:hypothetical protein
LRVIAVVGQRADDCDAFVNLFDRLIEIGMRIVGTEQGIGHHLVRLEAIRAYADRGTG